MKNKAFRNIALCLVLASGMTILVGEITNQHKVVRMYRSVRNSGRRAKKDILDIYAD